METRDQFVARRNSGSTFESETSELLYRLKMTDAPNRDEFLSRQDTIDSIVWLDDVLANNKGDAPWPKDYLLALLKLSSDHHRINYDLPASAVSEYKKNEKKARFRGWQRTAWKTIQQKFQYNYRGGFFGLGSSKRFRRAGAND